MIISSQPVLARFEAKTEFLKLSSEQLPCTTAYVYLCVCMSTHIYMHNAFPKVRMAFSPQACVAGYFYCLVFEGPTTHLPSKYKEAYSYL